MRRSNAATLTDVAREAGVAVMTASVVLNGARSSTRVSEATRIRIVEAATRLRYRPNAVARGLSRRRMDTIGVVATIDGDDINLYFLELLNGILQGAARHGQNTTVFSVKDWQAEEQRLLHLCDGRVDGIVLIGARLSGAFLETFSQRTPLVAIHPNECPQGLFGVDVDDEGGGYALTRYMIEQGHRRIAHISGGLDGRGASLRHAGYQRALHESGIAYDSALVVSCGYSAFGGRAGVDELAARLQRGQWPTGIFCGSDAIAAGCIETLAERGLQVPDDISVAGFDDLLLAKMTSPPLTTVRQPFRRMGEEAVAMLIQQIRSENPEESGDEIFDGNAVVSDDTAGTRLRSFEVDLVIRGSVGPPRALSGHPIALRPH